MTRLEFSDTSIYDEIYGYIPLTKIELDLVNHRFFQRLNHIKQLGAAYRVFPGAQHTRFSHSLGVMYIIDKMINAPNLKMPDEDKQKLRIAALLHDIGHYPLSHVIETVMTSHNTQKERKHEKLGEFIINNSSMADILKSNAIDPKEIGQIITGECPEPLFNQLMSSELDADRIDYLLRDSIHTGVAYGRFDLNRLMHTLSLDKYGQLCVDESGMHAAEGYVIGRYLMWAVVYTHRVINAFEKLVESIYQKCIGAKLPSFDQIRKQIIENESGFAGFDDTAVFKIICDGTSDGSIGELCKMFMSREVLAVSREEQELSENGKSKREYFLLDEFRKPERLTALAEASGVPIEWIFHNSSRTQLPNLRPLVERTTDKEAGQAEREMSKTIRIVDKDGSSTPLANVGNSIVCYLKNMSLDKVRIYTREEYNTTLATKLNQELCSA